MNQHSSSCGCPQLFCNSANFVYIFFSSSFAGSFFLHSADVGNVENRFCHYKHLTALKCSIVHRTVNGLVLPRSIWCWKDGIAEVLQILWLCIVSLPEETMFVNCLTGLQQMLVSCHQSTNTIYILRSIMEIYGDFIVNFPWLLNVFPYSANLFN